MGCATTAKGDASAYAISRTCLATALLLLAPGIPQLFVYDHWVNQQVAGMPVESPLMFRFCAVSPLGGHHHPSECIVAFSRS
jgi:hypothetical protein